MLAVQVSYFDLLEKERHNKATERLTQDELNENIRTHLANEELGRRNLSEVKRHNVVVENETQRHNIATENLSQSSLFETHRHNLATENLTRDQLAISRDNIALGYANLEETSRHNLATEEVSRATNAIQSMNAGTNLFNAFTNSRNATTNQQNANTNALNAEINQSAQALKQREYQETWHTKGAIPGGKDDPVAEYSRAAVSGLVNAGNIISSIIPIGKLFK